MGRHRTAEEKAALKERAAALRVAGVGAQRIARELGIGHLLCRELLRDVPKPASLGRPNAKDEHRAAALALRREGRTYDEIRRELGVSKGTLSLWLRGIPVPARATHGRDPEEARTKRRAAWDVLLAQREQERQAVMAQAAARVGALTPRELELVAVTAYVCEGAKSKPWRREERLTFVNSDPGLIRVFMAWLHQRGVGPDRLRLSLSIHESADVQAAERFWADVIGVPRSTFARPSLKRHNPKTVRRNTGDDYSGCLVVGVRQSRLLYQQTMGVWQGIVLALEGACHLDAAD